MATVTDIKDRISKLIALGENNPNPKEAELALSKARELMIQHQIEEDEIRGRVTTKEEVGITTIPNYPGVVSRPLWEDNLAVVIGKAFSSRIGLGRLSVSFYGLGADGEIAAHAFEQMRQRIWKMATIATQNHTDEVKRRYRLESIRGLSGPDHPKTWRNSYVVGVVVGLRRRLDEMKQSDTANVTSLVLRRETAVQEYMSTLKMGVKSIQMTNGNGSAYQQGVEAGKKLDVHAGIQAPSARGYIKG